MATGTRDERGASSFLPEHRTLPALREAARACRGCDLHARATQTVFGEGPRSARYVLVGEQPGDREDIEGAPFVGPAGAVLDRALEEAGLDRALVYVTNAVKHFKWTPRGKRRMHERPSYGEVTACSAWLEAELDVIEPRVVVCLGSTAAQAFFGASFRVTKAFGRVLRGPKDRAFVVTYHPSAVLRMRTDVERDAARHEIALALRLAMSVGDATREASARAD